MAVIGRPIVILSSPRSGSSMVAGCFAAHGVWVGPDKEPDEMNPKGWFENQQLAHLRFRDALTPENVDEVIRKQGYTGGPWLHKHTPRYAHCWRHFNPIWVFVRREIGSIAKSRMASNGLYDDPNIETGRSVALEDQMAMNDVRDRVGGFDVWAGKIIAGDYSDLYPAFDAADLPLIPKLLNEWVEPDLWHH